MQIDMQPPGAVPIAVPPVNRRAALQYFAMGAGAAAVAGAGGLTWLTTGGGVFATGTGPAYAPWGDAGPAGGPLSLVHAAVLASNAHNTQPWMFTVADNRIELFADMSRTTGTMDPLLREMHISLGCAVENLVLAGPANGIAATVMLLPEPAYAAHIASILLTPAPVARSPLFDAITDRHTNRGAYDTDRPVTATDRDTLTALVDAPDTQLVWFGTDTPKRGSVN